MTTLYIRYFPEYLELRSGVRSLGGVRENHRGYILPDDRVAVHSIFYCRGGVEEESFPVIPEYATRLYDGIGHAVFCGHDSRDLGANGEERCQPGIGGIRYSALRNDTFVGKYDEDRGLCLGDHVDVGHADLFRGNGRFYLYVGYRYGGGSGSAGGCDHGGLGIITVHVGI